MASSSRATSVEQLRDEHNQTVQLLQAEIQELQAQLQMLGTRVSQRGEGVDGDRNKPKPAKPEVFDPSKPGTNVRSWLFSLSNYFQAVGIPTHDFEKRRNYAVTLFRGPALEWWRQICLLEEKRQRLGIGAREGDVPAVFPGNPGSQALLTRLPSSWDEFEATLRARFELINATEAARNKLKGLRQLTSVQEYTRRFLALTAEIDDMTEAEMIDRYRDGLKRDLATTLAVYGIDNLQQIIATAERIDAVQHRGWHERRFQERYPTPGDRKFTTRDGPTPMELGAVNSCSGRGGPSQGAQQPRQQLKKTFDGQCYSCGKYGHRARDCRQPRNQQPKGGHQ